MNGTGWDWNRGVFRLGGTGWNRSLSSWTYPLVSKWNYKAVDSSKKQHFKTCFLVETFHGLVDPLFGSSWQEWHRYKLHRGIELDPWVKEWPPSWVYDLTHGRRRGLFWPLLDPMEQVWYSQLGTGLVQPNWNRIGTTMTNFRVFPYQKPKRSYSNFGNSLSKIGLQSVKNRRPKKSIFFSLFLY